MEVARDGTIVRVTIPDFATTLALEALPGVVRVAAAVGPGATVELVMTADVAHSLSLVLAQCAWDAAKAAAGTEPKGGD